MIEIGMLIDGRYRITGRIAHGGMADVYEGYDNAIHRQVAIKIMRTDVMENPKNISRFRSECIACASLNSPYVVKVYSHGEIDGRPYMANEYVSGHTLRDKLNVSSTHNLSPIEATAAMYQLSLGVSYIHEHGLLHRDLKPDNLFYLADGSIKIADFGIATKIGEEDKGDAVAGTVYYCAPEILAGKKAQVACDIYSMGIIFFELLVGNVPFDGESPEEVAVAHIKARLPEPSKLLPSIPKSLDRVIARACKKRPEERYASAAEFGEDLKALLERKDKLEEKKSLLSRIFGFK